MITIFTEIDELVGVHTVIASVTLKDYPLNAQMDVEFKVDIIERETIIEEVTAIAAWILMLFFVPLAAVGGFFYGRRY